MIHILQIILINHEKYLEYPLKKYGVLKMFAIKEDSRTEHPSKKNKNN